MVTKQVILVDKLLPDSMRFLVVNTLDKIIKNPNMSRGEIYERVNYLREEVERYC